MEKTRKHYIAVMVALGVITGFCLIMAQGCATIQKWPDCNVKMDQGSLLVKAANSKSLCLKDVGNGLILANGMAISLAKLYTAEQALTAVDKWVATLKMRVPAVVFRDLITKDIDKFPELFILVDPFYTAFSGYDVIDESSIAILVSYLEGDVRPLLVMRIEAAKKQVDSGVQILPGLTEERLQYEIRSSVERNNAKLGMDWKSEAEKREWMVKMGFLLSDEEIARITPRIELSR